MRKRGVRKFVRLEVLGLLAIVGIAVAATLPAISADHLDAPRAKKDGRVDINDVYVFHPGSQVVGGMQDLNKTVLVMTVNPAAGVISGTEFHPRARYEFLIDTDGNARPDIRVRARFSKPDDDGVQDVTVRWLNDDSEVIARGKTEEVIDGDDGVRVFAGNRDDGFFFDLANFNNGATFCTTGLPVEDFFLGLNTSAIVVELPTEMIGAGPVGVWGRTIVPGKGVIDRMGRPAILTVFIPPNPFEAGPDEVGNAEDRFNRTRPHRDQARWRDEIVNSLTVLFSLNDPPAGMDDPSDDAAAIQGLADVLLPDILTVDLSMATGFGFLNGRNLEDDVIDTELGLVTEGAVTTDCVANDSVFLADFPYLGVPNV